MVKLKAEGLSFGYPGQQQVLTDINVDVESGQVIGLIGENGSGKSTLLLNLLGVLKPTAGQIFFNGEPLLYDKASLRQLRQCITMVFQDPDQQIFYSDIDSDIAFALRNLGVVEAEIKERIDKALTLVDGHGFRHKPVQYLSYGQKKRVAIAGALVMKTDCLLMDEPTAGLDPGGREKMAELIKAIAAEGRHIIISSHDIDLIYEICDYLYVLKSGKMLAYGPVETVFLQEKMIEKASLAQPWLVKMHCQMGAPLFKTEACLFEYFKRTKLGN